MTEAELRQIAERAAAWAASPEGQERLAASEEFALRMARGLLAGAASADDDGRTPLPVRRGALGGAIRVTGRWW